MLITDLITLLQEKLVEHGNLKVGVYDNDFNSISDLELTTDIETIIHDDGHTESFPIEVLSIIY